MNNRIQSDFDLSGFNTLGVTSVAEYFAQCTNLEAFSDALTWARAKKLPVSILGGGSNTLLSQRISGLVIQPNFKGIEITSEYENKVAISVSAGENWHDFVLWAVHNGYSGIENLALIPGSVGAAPIQNIGAYGAEVASVIRSVECIDMQSDERITLAHADCEFAYRHSIFKEASKRHLCIYRVNVELNTEFNPNIHYAALKAEFAGKLPESALDVAIKVEKIRRQKLPDPDTVPNVGSFFKNPIVNSRVYNELKKRYPNIVAFDVDKERKKLAAAWLIDHRGWKHKAIDGVRVHAEQALVITNEVRANIDTVMALAEAIREDVLQHFGVVLEAEPQPLEHIRLR